MNRIDNTHATFLNCLRDWNDPFLLGHKPVKPYGCQRCEACACRSVHSSTNSLSQPESGRHLVHSKLDKKLAQQQFLTGFQPIIRCRSSANVPKAINQCIKSRTANPKSIFSRNKFNNSKVSSNSIDSDKESSGNVSKDEEFKILFQSSPDVSLLSKGTSELVQNNEMLRHTNIDQAERDEVLVESLRDTQNNDLSVEKHELSCLNNENKTQIERSNGDNLMNVLSSSTSSSIEDIVYDDSLQGESFESDSLMLDCDKKQPNKKDDRSELKETSTCEAKLSFVSDQDSMSNMDLVKLNIDETRLDTGCKNQSRLNSVQQGYKDVKPKRPVSLNDSIEDERNLLKKWSPNRSYSEAFLNDNDTDIDQDFDCSNSDFCTNTNTHRGNIEMAAESAKSERHSPFEQLEDQIKFYERVKDTFMANLDKSATLAPQSSSPKRRRSTSSEQKFLDSDKLVYKVCADNQEKSVLNELTLSSRSSSRSSSFNVAETETSPPQALNKLVQSISVPEIIVHETNNNENEKSIENIGCHGNLDQNIDKSIEKDSFKAEQIFDRSTESTTNKHLSKLNKRSKLCSFLSSSPAKKRAKMDEQPLTSSRIQSDSIDSQNLRILLEQELKTDNEDEFFLAISSHSLQTGSCPEFYWYPDGLKSSSKRARSQNDLITPKSYESITQSNYVQMINSMIHGAISDMADSDYADYLKRHIQGLFDNLTPVLMKSKSNEEIAMASPSRDKISQIINQSMPKSLSFDFKLLEESKLNNSEDAMDFSKFGLGIKDHESSDESLESNELERSFVESNESQIEELIGELIEQIESHDNFDSDGLKSSTRINFDDSQNEARLNGSSNQQSCSINDDSTPLTGSESCASTIVNVTLKNDTQNKPISVEANSDDDENVNLINSSDEYGEARRPMPSDSDDSDENNNNNNRDEYLKKNISLNDSLEDDVIIECKIDYRVKSGSDSDSSSSSSSFSDSDESDKKSSSDYDNMKQNLSLSVNDEPDTAMLSTSVHSLNSVESAHNLVNETLASLTSMNSESKSVDEDEEPEFIFGDDFPVDLDENWMQEDDWLMAGSTIKPALSLHSVRQLDPIAEEDERAKDEEIVFKKSQDLKHLFDSVENFKISFEYKYKPEVEKLRSQECNIKSLLLGSSVAAALDQQSSKTYQTNQIIADNVDYTCRETMLDEIHSEQCLNSNDGPMTDEDKYSVLELQVKHTDYKETCVDNSQTFDQCLEQENNTGFYTGSNQSVINQSLTECHEETVTDSVSSHEDNETMVEQQSDQCLNEALTDEDKYSVLELQVKHTDYKETSVDNSQTFDQSLGQENNTGFYTGNNQLVNGYNGVEGVQSLTECHEKTLANSVSSHEDSETMVEQQSDQCLNEALTDEDKYSVLELQVKHTAFNQRQIIEENIANNSQTVTELIEERKNFVEQESLIGNGCVLDVGKGGEKSFQLTSKEALSECYEEIGSDCQFSIEIRHTNNESITSEDNTATANDDSINKEKSLNETLTEFYEEQQQNSNLNVRIDHSQSSSNSYKLSVENKYCDKSKSCSSIETTSEKCDEVQKDSMLETRYSETSECESSFKTDVKLSPKCKDMQKDSLLEIETQYTGNADDTSSEGGSLKAENFDDLTHKYDEIEPNSSIKFQVKYESDGNELALSENSHKSDLETSSSEYQSDDRAANVSFEEEEEEVHVEYFEYVITNDLYSKVQDNELNNNPLTTKKKCESELDLSKLHLSLRDDYSNTSDQLKQVLSDIEKQIEVKSGSSSGAQVESKYQDKGYQVCPAELALNMVDCQTQSTPPLSPIKKLAPARKNAYTETDDSEIFSQYLISSEEQKLRQKLKEKENSLKQTTIATQTDQADRVKIIESLPARQNVRDGDKNLRKILIVNDNEHDKSTDSNLKLNIRQKIKIQNLDEYAKSADQLVRATDQCFNLPSSLAHGQQVKTTHLKSVDIQTDSRDENKEARSRSISNSSTFIDLLSLNLDRSKTWVELTEAKLNYMIGETNAVLRSMNLDSSASSDDEAKTNSPSLSFVEENNSATRSRSNLNNSATSPRIHLISPQHTLNCLTSTTKTIEEMTQLYLDNYKKQLEDSRKELSSKMSLLEAEKEKIAKIRDSRKKELYMRRQAAIQAFKLERERELKHSFHEDLVNSESIVYDDLDDGDDYEDNEFNQTLRTSKRLISDLPSQKREKLAKLRRNVVKSSSSVFDESYATTPRVDEPKKSRKYKNADSTRLLIPVKQKTYIQETTETRIEHTTSSSSNSSSIIDESRLLLKEYEQLRNDSVSEIQRAQDSLNASLLWLENQKQNRLRSFRENKPSKEVYQTSYSKSRTESGRSSRSDSINSSKPTKTRELSPVSRFREEQKEYLLRINTNNSSASNSNSNRKEIPISIYSPLSSSSFLSSPSSNYTPKRNPTSSNHKARVDQVSKSNTTKITITDYSAKTPSNQSSYHHRAGMPPPTPSHQSLKNKYKYISRKSSDSDEDKIC